MTQIIYIDGGGALEVEFLGLLPIFTLTVGSASGVDFGVANANRKIIVAVHALSDDGLDTQITGGNIGGIAATVLAGDCQSPGGPTRGDNGVWWLGADVPTGTSGTISITSSNTGGLSGSAILAVWRVINAINLTPTDTDVETFDTSPAVTVNADGLAGGVYFAATSVNHFSDVTLSGVAPDYSQERAPGSDARLAGGFALIPSDVLGQGATLTPDDADDMTGALAAVTFR